MDRTLICLGGGEIKTKETLAIDETIARLAKEHAGDKRARGLFIGTASGDFMPYFNSFRKTYTSVFDIKADCLLTVYQTTEKDRMKEKFDLCDFIYVGGGDTVFMIDKWKKDGVLDLIKEAYARGVILCGLSAGAICWFENMYTDSAIVKSDKDYSFFKGLGVLKGTCSPHYNMRVGDLHPSMIENGIKECYAIEDKAALVFKNETLKGALSCGGNAYVLRKNVDTVERYLIENINGEKI